MEKEFTLAGITLMLVAWSIVSLLFGFSIYKILKGNKIEQQQ